MSDLSADTARINAAIEAFASSQEAGFYWGTEDGYTWLTIEGDAIHPERYKELATGIATAAGVDFYAASIRRGSFEGALDWDMNEGERYTLDPNCNIVDYGERFIPAKPSSRPSF